MSKTKDSTKALFQAHTSSEIFTTSRWIRREIRPANTLFNGSGYWLCRRLRRDTGVSLSEREFGLVMKMAGYKPEWDADGKTRFRITLARETDYNHNPFCRQLMEYLDEDSPRGDFVRYMAGDRSFPAFANRDVIRYYLKHRGCSPEMLETFEVLWKQYDRDHNGKKSRSEKRKKS